MSKLEQKLALQLRAAGIGGYTREYRFHSQRRWRFDFAWPALRLAVEVEGVTHFGRNKDGSYRLGRHQTKAGLTADCDKYNSSLLEGWRVLRFTQHHIGNLSALDTIREALALCETAVSDSA